MPACRCEYSRTRTQCHGIEAARRIDAAKDPVVHDSVKLVRDRINVLVPENASHGDRPAFTRSREQVRGEDGGCRFVVRHIENPLHRARDNLESPRQPKLPQSSASGRVIQRDAESQQRRDRCGCIGELGCAGKRWQWQ